MKYLMWLFGRYAIKNFLYRKLTPNQKKEIISFLVSEKKRNPIKRDCVLVVETKYGPGWIEVKTFNSSGEFDYVNRNGRFIGPTEELPNFIAKELFDLEEKFTKEINAKIRALQFAYPPLSTKIELSDNGGRGGIIVNIRTHTRNGEKIEQYQ